MFSNPEKNLQSLGLSPGDIVADFGSGSGFYALSAARAVSAGGGKVYAIDIQKDLLERLKNSASREGIHNISIIWGDAEKLGGTHLKDASVDSAIVSNILFQAVDKAGLVKEVNRILKPGGKVLFIDWSDETSIGGPDSGHMLSEEAGKALFIGAGFEFVTDTDAGAHHYGMIFRKPK